MSTLLRPSAGSNITLFRIILPLIFLYYLKNKTKDFFNFFKISLFILIYSYLVSHLSHYSNFNIVFLSYYILLIFYFYWVDYISKKIGFVKNSLFLKYLFYSILLLGILQYTFGGLYPNTQNRLPKIYIFFWNENEYSSVLGCLFLIYFFIEKNNLLKFTNSVIVVLIVQYNEARLVTIAIIFFIISYFILQMKMFQVSKKSLFFYFIIFAISIYQLRNIYIFENNTISDLLFYPLEHLINLEPVINIGSLNNRLNAIIYGTIELKQSYFLGIGPGNSLDMMENIIEPGSEEWTAYSMHNVIYQTITELGVLGFILIVVLIRKIYKLKSKSTIFPIIVIFYIALSLIVSISSGAYTNYFFLFGFYFSFYLFENINLKENVNLKIEQ
jgi:teichuronic acid biosynthesis protein TuaE